MPTPTRELDRLVMIIVGDLINKKLHLVVD